MSEEQARTKPRVHRQVVEALALSILRGEMPPGHVLPPESTLCDTFGISRSALREAIRALKEKGLLDGRPRAGTIVRPRRDWNRLDSDLLRLSFDCAPDRDFIGSLIEARQTIEPVAARMAATRAEPADIAALNTAFDRMALAKARGDFASFNSADIAFHQALLRASGNAVFLQLSMTIAAALAYVFRIQTDNAKEPGASLPQHHEVIRAIEARDGMKAMEVMNRLLEIALVDLGQREL